MRHLILPVLLFLSAYAFSQTSADSIFTPTSTTSVVVQKVDTAQIARIENIEKNLSAFYTYNRRYHSLLFISLGVSVAGILLSSGNTNNEKASVVLPIVGSVIGLIGTVIYFDSYKFLNFKPKRREIRKMTYY